MSKTILAKDVIGIAQEIITVDEIRNLLSSLGTAYYNMAIMDVYNVLCFAEQETFITNAELTLGSPSTKYVIGDLTTDTDFDNYDKLIAVEITNSTATLDCFPLPIKDFLIHKSKGSAQSPYNEGVIYTESKHALLLLFGSSVTLSTPKCYVYFRKQPTLLTSANYSSATLDLPDKYLPFVVNRIASYAELRKGVTDGSLMIVKSYYEQLLANVEPVIKNQMINSLKYTPLSNVGE